MGLSFSYSNISSQQDRIKVRGIYPTGFFMHSAVAGNKPGVKPPVVFEEFFDLGLQETVSPFLTPESRHWGANLTIKAAIVAAVLLFISFTLSFSPTMVSLSNLLLVVVYFLVGI